jgi:Recombination endonuclease VII
MKLRAVCPECATPRELVELPAARGVRLVVRPHRAPVGGMCLGGGVRIARHLVIHPCVDCVVLPVVPAGIELPAGADPVRHGYRPLTPRAASGVPPRCATHKRAHRKALKAVQGARRREQSRGFAEADRELLWETQGRRCAICLVPLKVTPQLDHDHDRAAEHDHPDDQVCRQCARGLLCKTCNLHVVGRLDVDALLRALAWRTDNAATELGWWDEPEPIEG